MKLLVTGVKGQLGHDIVNECNNRNIEAVGVDVEEMDITDAGKVAEVIKSGNYNAVIHCAAWTAVDKAEDEVELCTKVNVDGTRNIANICKELDERHPLNVYGQTKYEGELIVESLPKHFIVRIAWVFGINGNNFIKTMLRLGKERGAVCVVDDQIGSPTYTYDLSKLVVDMIQTDKYGIYHATNEGLCSWYEFACEIFKQAGMSVEVTPVDSNAFPAKAKRPNNSRMSKAMLDKNGFGRLPTWQDALSRYLKEIDY